MVPQLLVRFLYFYHFFGEGIYVNHGVMLKSCILYFKDWFCLRHYCVRVLKLAHKFKLMGKGCTMRNSERNV